ncbi:hypothetical protein I79_007646 [Cricetulus griseus]|uniref:Uncharacterized protein n=1 Tax=Cricetulus griseus TaxID=10029 RepID=G3HB31_CRIGR|nr:hypothetical protein I79_007646 [Cricetulus griseus]
MCCQTPTYASVLERKETLHQCTASPYGNCSRGLFEISSAGPRDVARRVEDSACGGQSRL